MTQMPEQAKLAVDVLAAAGWISVLLGVLTNAFAFLAAVCSFGWAALRLHTAWKEKQKQKESSQ